MKEIKKTYITPVVSVLKFNTCAQILTGSTDVSGNSGAEVDVPGPGGDINMSKDGNWDDIDGIF